MAIGRVVALDEAHKVSQSPTMESKLLLVIVLKITKYMNASTEAATLTNSLLSTIRLQRHLGVRTIISTQEPTVSPALLDLCSVTIAHRFTSPEWLRSLRSHLAAVADCSYHEPAFGSGDALGGKTTDLWRKNESAERIFAEIVKLRVGEAILFAPDAMVAFEVGSCAWEPQRLGAGFLKVRVRKRLTLDGGKSVMAS